MGKLDLRERFTPNNDGDIPEEGSEPKKTVTDVVIPEGEDEDIEPVVDGEGADEEGSDEDGVETPKEDDEGSGEEGEPADPADPPKEDETPEQQAAKRLQALKEQEASLMRDISDLRSQRRDLREGKSPSKAEEPVIIEQSDDLADLDPAVIGTIERVMKAKGYVKKSDIEARDYHSTVKSEQDAWLQDHPEYLPANDPNDEKWNKLTSTIKRFFGQPQNPKDVRDIFDMAHAKLGGTSRAPALPVKPKASIDAGKAKLKTSSVPAGGSAGARSPKAAPTGKVTLNDLRKNLQGFTDEELEELVS